jgi:DNA-directed RNA polymerase subunit RPC12/RpoP
MKRIYRDGITDFTEPFWDNLCSKCSKRFWSVTLDCVCPRCGSEELYILNETKHLKHNREELERFHRKIMEEKEDEDNNNNELQRRRW